MQLMALRSSGMCSMTWLLMATSTLPDSRTEDSRTGAVISLFPLILFDPQQILMILPTTQERHRECSRIQRNRQIKLAVLLFS